VVFFTAGNSRRFVVCASRLAELLELGTLTPDAAVKVEGSRRAIVGGGWRAHPPAVLQCPPTLAARAA
jgi:hypothetical protein